MLFQSSIRRELARTFGATLVVLITIVLTMMLIRTLGQASLGKVNPSEVPLILGYTLLGNLPVVLALSLFVAIMASLSRMYRDSEMVIWFSSGKSLISMFGPLFRFAWPILLVIALLTLFLLPWSNLQVHDLRKRFERRNDIERVTPGKFEESASGRRVFFIDKESPDSRTGSNIFVSTTEGDRETITSARNGRIEIRGDRRYILLESGQRLEMSKDRSKLRVAKFTEFGVAIDDGRIDPGSELTARSRSSLQLLLEPSPRNQGELSWRLGLIFAAINFLVIATASSTVNPRVGRGGGLMLALFAFIVYFNLLNLGQNWIGLEQVSLGTFMVALHGSALLLGTIWIALRHHNITLRWLLARAMAKPAP